MSDVSSRIGIFSLVRYTRKATTLALAALVLAGFAPLAAGPSCAAENPDSLELQDRLLAMPIATLPGVSSVAVNDDATALFTNPAGIDRSIPVGYYLAWEKAEFGGTDQATAGVTLGTLGLAYQKVRPQKSGSMDRIVLATGGNAHSKLAFGTSSIWQRQNLRGPDESTWRISAGMLWRPSRALSLGAVANDLTQGRMSGRLFRRTYIAGLGFRPLPMDDRSRLTLFADLSGDERMSWSDEAVLQAGVQVEPIRGIELSGAIAGPLGNFSDERTYRVGLGLHHVQNSTLVGAMTQRNEAGRTSTAAPSTRPRAPSPASAPGRRNRWWRRCTCKASTATKGRAAWPCPSPSWGHPLFPASVPCCASSSAPRRTPM